MYWVFADDNWYVGYWYNGPWHIVYPDYVPVFLLRVPVYYYRHSPLDGVVREHQQSLEDSIRRPTRQWSVPAPKGGEPPGLEQ